MPLQAAVTAATGASSPWLALLAAASGLAGLVTALVLGVCCCLRPRTKHDDDDAADDETRDVESARPALIHKNYATVQCEPLQAPDEAEGATVEDNYDDGEHHYEDVEQARKKSKRTWFSRRE
jgi:hypothetical protein